MARYARALVLTDGAVLAVAALLAVYFRFGEGSELYGVSYYLVAVALVLLWWAVLGLSRCYEPRFLGSGTEEFKRVTNASIRLVATLAFIAYAFKVPLARGFVAIALP